MCFASIPETSKSGNIRNSRTHAGPTVLLVDDDAALRRIVGGVIQRLGYSVIAAEDAVSALRLAGDNPGIRVVLTDIIMPEVNGVQLAQLIRASGHVTQFLFYSGYSAAALQKEGVQVDPGLFLPKPFHPDQLQLKLSELLGFSG